MVVVELAQVNSTRRRTQARGPQKLALTAPPRMGALRLMNCKSSGRPRTKCGWWNSAI